MSFNCRQLIRTSGLILTTAILLLACGPQTTKPDRNASNPDSLAAQYITSDRFLEAAEEYLRLAELYPEQETDFRLKAAQAYFDGGIFDQARQVAENTDITTDNPIHIFTRNILLAELSLIDNEPDKAISALGKKPPTGMPERLIRAYHEIRANAYELKGNTIRSVREYIALAEFQNNPAAVEKNTRSTWTALNRLNLRELTRARQSTSGEITSWIELAIIYQSNLFKPDLLQRELEVWRNHYLDHRANAFLLKEILQSSGNSGVQPKHIALLLPFLEPYKTYSEAIRDGFLSAWYMSEHYRPIVNIYHADSLNIKEIYKEAVENGADFIVGPLEKEAIARLMEMSSLPVTTLALNQYNNPETLHRDDDLPYPKLMQFDLSPEDEALQVADQAIEDGTHRALIIAIEGEWGQRLVRSFTERWLNAGGKIIDYINFEANTTDFSFPVMRLLNINSSENRTKLLQQKLNKRLKSESRLRQDADMIFLVADPTAARQIVPQLRFYRADSIPVYSTRFLFSGSYTAQLDNDINGVMFTDFPWVVDPDSKNSIIHKYIDTYWSANTSKYNRMYALGVDAFNLIPNISRLATQASVSFSGETGDLYLTKDGMIKRKLLWAQFIDGEPRLLNKE